MDNLPDWIATTTKDEVEALCRDAALGAHRLATAGNFPEMQRSSLMFGFGYNMMLMGEWIFTLMINKTREWLDENKREIMEDCIQYAADMRSDLEGDRIDYEYDRMIDDRLTGDR